MDIYKKLNTVTSIPASDVLKYFAANTSDIEMGTKF